VGWRFLLATAEVARHNQAVVLVVTNKRSIRACAPEVHRRGLGDVVLLLAASNEWEPSWFRWKDPRMIRLEHILWSRRARGVLKRLQMEYEIVYAQHVTFASEILPTPITALDPRTLRVWGPVGSAGVPFVFRQLPWNGPVAKQYILQILRNVSAQFPARYTARRVDKVVLTGDATRRLFGPTPEITTFPNVIVDAELLASIDTDEAKVGSAAAESLSILCVGHLIPRKRFDVAIRTLADPRLGRAHLHIVGNVHDSSARYLESYASRLGVARRVTFHGRITRPEVLKLMMSCSVLFHPSGREGSPHTIGEAAAVGLPVVCFAGTGAATVLAEGGSPGVILPTGNWSISRREVAGAVLKAAELPRRRSEHWTEERYRALCSAFYDEGRRRIDGARAAYPGTAGEEAC
jgi:glycosyltransferase involved in cell wall biosynthesis